MLVLKTAFVFQYEEDVGTTVLAKTKVSAALPSIAFVPSTQVSTQWKGKQSVSILKTITTSLTPESVPLSGSTTHIDLCWYREPF